MEKAMWMHANACPEGDVCLGVFLLMADATGEERYMREALRLARRGAGATSPNPMVGAVLVAGDEIVGAFDRNQRTGIPRLLGRQASPQKWVDCCARPAPAQSGIDSTRVGAAGESRK
jgi:hypothetical protein